MKLLKETIPFYFEKYEERVKNNNYIANNSVSFLKLPFFFFNLVWWKVLNNSVHWCFYKPELN